MCALCKNLIGICVLFNDINSLSTKHNDFVLIAILLGQIDMMARPKCMSIHTDFFYLETLLYLLRPTIPLLLRGRQKLHFKVLIQ